MTIIAGVSFGGETGFLVGAMTMLASTLMWASELNRKIIAAYYISGFPMDRIKVKYGLVE